MSKITVTPSLSLSPVQRLEVLLPWINQEPTAHPAERLSTFLSAGFVRPTDKVLVGVWHRDFDVEDLRSDLHRLLDGDVTLRVPSLALSVEHAGDQIWPHITGSIRDIVVYEVWRILTSPGSVVLHQCHAPQARDWRRRCGKWFVERGARRGRSREYCTDRCRQMAHRRGKVEDTRSTRRKKGK